MCLLMKEHSTAYNNIKETEPESDQDSESNYQFAINTEDEGTC